MKINGVPLSYTRVYRILTGMKNRCYNKNNKHFKSYGAKGIEVCEEWLGHDGACRFCEWALSHGYDDNMTIDRIDPSKGYNPKNCMWVSQSINSGKLTPKQRTFYKSLGIKNFEFYDEGHNCAIV